MYNYVTNIHNKLDCQLVIKAEATIRHFFGILGVLSSESWGNSKVLTWG